MVPRILERCQLWCQTICASLRGFAPILRFEARHRFALTGDPWRACALLRKATQRLTKAEGTRFELATGCPAPHFQCDIGDVKTGINLDSAENVHKSSGAQRKIEKRRDSAENMARVVSVWAKLPTNVEAAIMAFVELYEG